MSLELQLDMTGLDELIRHLPELADSTVRGIALDVEGEAKRRAPVDTGLLRSSIRMVDPVRGDYEAQVQVGAEYGIHVHEGAQGRTPKPFLEQALTQGAKRAEARLEKLARQMEEK